MALEDLTGPAKFISNLVANNPTPDDWADEGDDHVRGIKNVLRNTFPRATKDVFRELLGMIAPFTVQPPGWVLCNGQVITEAVYPALFQNLGIVGAGNYTVPDLRGYFVRGRDFGVGVDPDGDRANYAISQNDAMTGHSHLLTDPGHTHTVPSGGIQGGQSQGYTTPGTMSNAAQVTGSALTGATVGGIASFGGTFGANKVINGDFSSGIGTGWSAAGGGVISGGALTLTYQNSTQQGPLAVIAGRAYQLKMSCVGGAGGSSCQIGIGSSAATPYDIFVSNEPSPGVYTHLVTMPPGISAVWVTLYNPAVTPLTVVVDDVSFYEYTGAGVTVQAREVRPRNIALTYCMYVGG